MSINNDDIFNSRIGFQNNFSVYRNNFLISSTKNNNNFNNHNKLNENSCESLDSFMFQRKNNEKRYKNRFLLNNKSMIDINPNFNEKKKNFHFSGLSHNNNNNLEVNQNIEEVPAFCYENDMNVKSFRSFLAKKNETLENNYKNYLIFMKNQEHEKSQNNKKQLMSPYSIYIKKVNEMKNNERQFLPRLKRNEISNIKMDINRYDKQNDISFNSFDTERRNKYNKFMMNKYLAEVEKNDGKKLLNNRSSFEIEKNIENENNNKSFPRIANSPNNINKYFPKTNEISNPELFYRKCDKDFYNLRKQYKKYDDYNYKLILLHKTNRFLKKEPDVNPFNPKINFYKSGNSSLEHNIILRPYEFYGNFRNGPSFFLGENDCNS